MCLHFFIPENWILPRLRAGLWSTAQYFPNAWIREWDGIAHGVLAASACADLVAAVFLSNPSQDPFYLTCLERENPVSFELD